MVVLGILLVGAGADRKDIEQIVEDIQAINEVLVDSGSEGLKVGSDREERGLSDFFSDIIQRVKPPVSLVRGGNNTYGDERGIFDFIGNIANSILGGADDKVSGPVLIPNHCW